MLGAGGVVEIKEPAGIAECAEMMASSPPWDVLHFSRKQCLDSLSHPALRIHACLGAGGDIVGFLASMEHGIGFEPMIEYLCVREDCRGQGIGTQLVGFFEDQLFPEADNLYLFVSDINPGAARLYNRLCYLQVGAIPDFNLQAQTEFLMRKTRRPIQEARVTEEGY